MKVGKNGSELIKKFEQFRNHPYIDAVGVPTIGWGNTYYEDGSTVEMTDKPLTRQRGNELHKFILEGFEDAVNRYVKSEINNNQFDALVSLAYNIGVGNFRSSTLLKRVNADPCDYDIEFQFKRWNKGRVLGVLQELKGLTKRRNEEAYLYFQSVEDNV